MPGPEEGAGGSSSAADRRSRQERRGRPHLPPELQEGEGEERGLPEDVGVPHYPARVRFCHSCVDFTFRDEKFRKSNIIPNLTCYISRGAGGTK